MFFADPAVAFANVALGLRSGGRLAFVCWQRPADNEWIMILAAAIGRHIALPPPDDPEARGFSLGERDRIVAVLEAAGLTDATIEPVAEPLWLGRDIADTIAFIETTRIATSLLGDADRATIDRIRATMHATLEPYVTPDGVRLGSRAWLVTARCAVGSVDRWA